MSVALILIQEVLVQQIEIIIELDHWSNWREYRIVGMSNLNLYICNV